MPDTATDPSLYNDPDQDLFDKSVTFADLGLSERVVNGLTEAGFVHPTAIQAELIPHIMAGKDVIGQAKTGTGKTAALRPARPLDGRPRRPRPGPGPRPHP